jgi:cysteine-S-conjugate beta-lyase
VDVDPGFDFDQRIERRQSDSYKWDANQSLFGRSDLLPFWVADMDFATPAPVLDAIRRRCEHPILGYGLRSGEYFSAIQDWLSTRHNWQVPREWLMFCPPSSIVGISGIIAALTEPGATIAAPTPTYGPLLGLIEKAGRRLIRNPLREVDGHFELDIDDLAQKLEADTQMIIICSPHNPVGRVFRRDELVALADLAEERDLIVVSDEVHCDLVLPGHRHLPFGSIGGKRSVTVVSPNKTFNTAGIPQSTLVIPDAENRARFQYFLDTLQLNHDSTFSAEGMLAAYRNCATWLDQLIIYLAANHELAEKFLRERVPAVVKVHAEATYLGWLDCRQLGLGQDEIMQRLVEVGGVGLYGGTEFGKEGEGFFRMNLACPRKLLQQGLVGIEKALGDIRPGPSPPRNI